VVHSYDDCSCFGSSGLIFFWFAVRIVMVVKRIVVVAIINMAVAITRRGIHGYTMVVQMRMEMLCFLSMN
jgi:hypothetical protein